MDISYVAANGFSIKFLPKITPRSLPKIKSPTTDSINTSGAATISSFVPQDGNSKDHVQDHITRSNQSEPSQMALLDSLWIA